MFDRGCFISSTKEESSYSKDVHPISKIAPGLRAGGYPFFRTMTETISKLLAVLEAMNYCCCWNHPYKDLELTFKEFNDLLIEKNDAWISASHLAALTRSSTYIRAWGVDIRAEEFPRHSVIRTRYLQLINPSPWIDQLAEDMEKYR